MNKPDFLFLLLGASYASFKFAKVFVKDDLIAEFKYDLELNISHDNPELKQFDIYPDDNEKKYFDLTDKEVVEKKELELTEKGKKAIKGFSFEMVRSKFGETFVSHSGTV